MRRLTGLYGVLPAVVVTIVTACSGPATPSAARASEKSTVSVDPGVTEIMPDAAPERGDWLRLRLPAEMPNLNPLTSTDYYSFILSEWLFDGLLIRDPATQEMKPRLAESYEISDDHLIYTFRLRKDVVFSDGVPLTARDVKFTFDKAKNPTVDAPQLRSYLVDLTSVEVPDDYTAVFTCAKPYFKNLSVFGEMQIIPEHIYGIGDFNNHPNNRNPIGSGAYILEKWETGREVVLVRNPKYWAAADDNNRPYFDRIIYSIITDDNASFQLLMRGDLDARGLAPEEWVRRADTPKFKERFNRLTFNLPAYSYIGWNMRKPQFSDKQVRKALAMLMDRESIRAKIYMGLATVISHGFMPGSPEYNENLKPLPFDPVEAGKLLDNAGWKDNDGDGLRDKDGAPFRFDVSTTNQNPMAEQVLTGYKEELARTGIELNIRPMEWASLLDQVDKREFDAVLMAWHMEPDSDPYQLWHSSQADKGSNYVGFINPEADQLIEQARMCFDTDARMKMYHRFAEIITDEQPYLFLLSSKGLLAVEKHIQGIRSYPFGPKQRDWFIPRVFQRYGR